MLYWKNNDQYNQSYSIPQIQSPYYYNSFPLTSFNGYTYDVFQPQIPHPLNSFRNNGNSSVNHMMHCHYMMEALESYHKNNICQIGLGQFDNANININNIPGNCRKDSSELISSSTAAEEVGSDLVEIFKKCYPYSQIGKYDWKSRVMKIIKYKINKIRRQSKQPVIKKYDGRSKVAVNKPRYKGRFIKNSVPISSGVERI